MNKRKKVKLALVSACAATSALEQLINTNPASFGLESPQLNPTQYHGENEEDDELNSLFFHGALLSCSLGLTDEAGWWVKPRMPAWFDKFLLEVNDRASWFNALRMSKETFLWMCTELQPLLNRKVTRFRDPIPVQFRLGAALYRLTHGTDLHVISEKFGIGVSSTQSCVTDTVKAINQHFGSFIKFPQGEAVKEVVSGFEDKSELLNCLGAIGVITLQVMPTSFSDSITSSISLQGICDTSYRFLNVYCGSWQDITHPLRPGLARTAALLSAATEAEGSMHYFVGDGSFPLLPWLLVRYEDGSDTPIMAESFNRRHASGVMHVKVSFGILKETFKILSRCVKHGLPFVPSLLSACCVLQNLLLEKNEIPVDRLLRGPLKSIVNESPPVPVSSGCEYGTVEEQQGQELRDHLAEMFFRSDL